MTSVKGKSGKTILTATFGAVLAALGKKVLLVVDTDAVTNGLTLLYLNEVIDHRDSTAKPKIQSLAGTYEMAREGRVPTGIMPVPTGADLLPAAYFFFNTEGVDVIGYGESFAAGVEVWRMEYDYIFLDAHAGSDLYAHSAMRQSVSDRVVIVSDYDPLSAAGVERLKALFADDLTYDRTWVLLNKMLPDIAKGYGEFLEISRYLPLIPWDADVVRAYSRRSTALDLEYEGIHLHETSRDSAARNDLVPWTLRRIAPGGP